MASVYQSHCNHKICSASLYVTNIKPLQYRAIAIAIFSAGRVFRVFPKMLHFCFFVLVSFSGHKIACSYTQFVQWKFRNVQSKRKKCAVNYFCLKQSHTLSYSCSTVYTHWHLRSVSARHVSGGKLPPPENANSPWIFAAGRNFSKKSYFTVRIYKKKPFVPSAVPGRQSIQNCSCCCWVCAPDPRKSSLQRSSSHSRIRRQDVRWVCVIT